MASKPALPPSRNPILRIVTVGKTGIGKSAVGNTILGRRAFESKVSPTAVTSKCQKETGQFKDQELEIVDTPGLLGALNHENEVKREIATCVWLSAPGPHVFLVVMALNRFTDEDKKTVDHIKNIFGEQAANYTMVLFTHGDDLEADGTSAEEFIAQSGSIDTFIRQCGGGYHVFNNRSKDPSQVRELLKKIDTMVQRNGGRYFTNEMFRKAERVIGEDTERRQRENPTMSYEEARSQSQREEGLFNKFMWLVAFLLALVFILLRPRGCIIQ